MHFPVIECGFKFHQRCVYSFGKREVSSLPFYFLLVSQVVIVSIIIQVWKPILSYTLYSVINVYTYVCITVCDCVVKILCCPRSLQLKPYQREVATSGERDVFQSPCQLFLCLHFFSVATLYCKMESPPVQALKVYTCMCVVW